MGELNAAEPPAPPAAVNPIAAAPGITPKAAAIDWGSLLERFGKHVVLASLVIYALGYIITVEHYTSTGVTAPELSHNTYIGAGLLFALMLGLAIAAFRSVRADLEKEHSSPKWKKIVVVVAAYLTCSQAVFTPLGSNSVTILAGFHGYFILSIAVVGAGEWVRRRQPSFHRLVFAVVSALVVLVTTFTMFVFPLALPEFGGGRPLLLYAWNRGDRIPDLIPDSIKDLRCEPELSDGPACRIISWIYTGTSHLYFSVEERATECPDVTKITPSPIGRMWTTPVWANFRAKGTRICFARVADTEIKTLPIQPLR